MSDTVESWTFELLHSAIVRSRALAIGAAVAALALGTSAVVVGVGALDRPRELPLPRLSATDPILLPAAAPVFVVSHQGPPSIVPSTVPQASAVRPVRIVVPRIGVDAPVVRL